MKPKKVKIFYRQKLPHLQPIGASFFVTFRLKDSVPIKLLSKAKDRHLKKIELLSNKKSLDTSSAINEENIRFFYKYDELLDKNKNGPHYMKDPEIAEIIKKELHRFDGDLYDLVAYTIMSNHVHILIDTNIQAPDTLTRISDFEEINIKPLETIMKRIKGPTAVYANRLLKRKGQFWQRESYDRFIRDGDEYHNTIWYILNNPVKAQLVKEWESYSFSYLRPQE